MDEIEKEIKGLLVKVLIPSLVTISITLSIQMRKRKVTILNAILTTVTGVGSAFLFSPFIYNHFSDDKAILMIALATISGEKIGVWLMYQFKVDSLMNHIFDWVVNKFKR